MATSGSSDLLLNQPIVIDNGTGVIKAGLSGADKPKSVFPCAVGRPKHVRMMPGGSLEGSDIFVGNKLMEHRGAFKISYPMEHGVVTNWQDMERVWDHVLSRDELDLNAEEHPVLLTEAPLNPDRNREKMAEIFFESFNVPSLFVSPQAVLSLYASGRTTGVVLDVGDGVSHAVPVYEGFVLPYSVTRSDVAGRDVTTHLQRLLRRAGCSLHTTSAEFDIVRQIKEQCCYVAFNPAKEEEHTGGAQSGSFVLPDGTTVALSSERFRAPETLFHPEVIGSECPGVQETLTQSIMRSDMDLRKTLFSGIVLAGGSTLFLGFGDRLLNEVRKSSPKDMKIRISAPQERKVSTWIGGSILASLSTFHAMCATKEQWSEDHGVVHRRRL